MNNDDYEIARDLLSVDSEPTPETGDFNLNRTECVVLEHGCYWYKGGAYEAI